MESLLVRGSDSELFWRNMLALVGLGFCDRVRQSLSKLDKTLLNEGLLRTCGDAWWDNGRFDSDRIILCRILVELGAALDCENEFHWKPVQIAECWNRKELVEFLTHPNRKEEPPKEIAQPPPLKMVDILKQRQEREALLRKQRELKSQIVQEPFSPQKMQNHLQRPVQQRPVQPVPPQQRTSPMGSQSTALNPQSQAPLLYQNFIPPPSIFPKLSRRRSDESISSAGSFSQDQR